MADSNEPINDPNVDSNEPVPPRRASDLRRSRTGSLTSLDGQPAQRRTSALGNEEPKRTASQLQRLGLVAHDSQTRQPERSPVGAIRVGSGLNARVPPAAGAAPATAGGAGGGAGAAFDIAEVQDEGTQWHNIDLEEFLKEVDGKEEGLSAEQAQQHLNQYGLNCVKPPPKMHPFLKFLISLVWGFQLMMNIGAVLCFIVYGISKGEDNQTLALGVMLVVVVFLTSAFQTYQEGKADKIMEELQALAADNVFVYRDGKIVELPSEQITVGDLVQVKAGEKVPADMRILTATDLKVNNSSMTGENVDVKLGRDPQHSRLSEAKNIARSGCVFTSGHGTGIVFAVGEKTLLGAIANSTLQKEHPDTLMKREIDRMILILSVLAVVLGVAFAIIAVFFGFTWVEAVAFGIGIIVANVPEGLLSQLVVTLALTAKNLKKHDVLVTNLEIIETLGAVSVICSDKTGTLTCNRMTVSHVVYDGVIHTTPHTTDRDEDKFEQCDDNAEAFQALRRVLTLNTDAIFLNKKQDQDGGASPTEPTKEMQPVVEDDDVLKRPTKGDASESALIKFAQPYRDIIEYRQANPRLAAIPFNSANKWMLSVNAHEEPDKPVQVLVKGAPERLLDSMCSSAHMDGKIVDWTPEVADRLIALNEQLASRGERVLAFAYANLPSTFGRDFVYDVDSEVPNFPTNNLCFAGFISLIDPPRPGVKDAVADCRRAGIKVFMVTGDHPMTALAIARNIGIATHETANEMRARGETVPEDYYETIAVHGSTMMSYEQADWDHVLKHKEIVFARTMPHQKQEIVEQLHAIGEVTAMTGDGVNDAPALKAAYVGVAMGSGASVAKEAAQVIVMKDDFTSIVRGIRAGRLVFACLKKVITYVLVSNTPQILPFLFFVAAGVPLGIETIVILTIDLGTDILPAIAMAYEPEENDTMGRPPRGPDAHLVTVQMIAITYATVGMMHTFASYFGFFYVLLDLGFPLGKLFGAGLGFRSDYDDLNDDRKRYMTELCNEMGPEYFDGRNRADPTICTTQFADYRQMALRKAQASFFFTIIWGQVANIFIRKTFTETILTPHRLLANKHVLVAIVFELWLALMLVYVPGLNGIFLMEGISAEYLFVSIWYIPVLIIYDEIRKYFVRNWPNGCCAKVTDF